jgi:TonB family protein
MPDWQSCEGQLLDGKFPLERYAGGDNDSAVFLAESVSKAIRIRRANLGETAALAARWNSVKRLRHPHLLEIDAAGTSTLAGEPVAYLVMERAEQNLADVLQGRPLTADEAKEMLLPVAVALDYLHRRGMAHGDLKASKIFAIGNTVKLSSESVAEGDAAADIRALGLTLIDALSPRAETPPDGNPDRVVDLPGLFGEIAKGCLNSDPASQWTADRVVTRLRPREPNGSPLPAAPAQAGKPVTAARKLPRLAAPVGLVAVALAVVAGVVVLRRTDSPTPPAPAVEPRQAPAAVSPEQAPAAPTPATTPAPKTAPPAQRKEEAQSTRDRQAMEDGVVRRVVPDIPEFARNTIRGRPTAVVRVTVDGMGNVTQAAVERGFSPYFSRFALEAARQWKFVPEEGANSREWILRFAFSQKDTQATAQRAAGK